MALTRITKGVIKPNENYDTHNINSTGIITAIGFKGPFTGSSDIQSGILTATKIDLNGDIDVDGHTNLDNVSIAGVVTATTINATTFAGAISGTTGTFSGNVSIGGTLTYEDVTNIDSVGLVTARAGVKIPDSQSLILGSDDDAELKHTGSNLVIRNTTGNIRIEPKNGQLAIQSQADERTSIYFSGSKKIETTDTGAVISGILTATSLYISDGIKHKDDVNTEIGFPGNDTFAVTTNGNERLRIASDGKVGIGTDNPTSTTLHVRGTSQVTTGIGNTIFKVTSTTFRVDQCKATSGWNNMTHAVSPLIKTGWLSGLGDHLYLSSGGNTAESGQMVLLVSDGHGVKVGKSAWDGSNNTDLAAGTEYFRITTAGKVGIGTDNPLSKLHLANTNSTVWPFTSAVTDTYGYTPYPHELIIDNDVRGTTGSFAGIYFNAGADSDGSKVSTARIAAIDTGDYKADLVFATRGYASGGGGADDHKEHLRITSAGKVGINTTTPSQQLTSYAASGYPVLANGPSNGIGLGNNGAIVFGNKDVTSYAKGILDASELEFKISGTPKVYMHSNGKVSIGVDNDAYEFTVQGSGGGAPTVWLRDGTTSGNCRILFGDTDNAGQGAIYYKNNGDSLNFYAGGNLNNERLEIKSNGQVKVTSNTEPQLDVHSFNSAAGASIRVQSAGAYAYHMAISTNIHWRWGMPTGSSDWVLRDSTNNRDRFWVDTGNAAYFKGTNHTNLEVRSGDASTKALVQTVQGSDIRIGASTNHPLALYAGGLEKARINTSGNLGVGINDPSQARLVAQTASGMSIAAVKDNTGASISLGGVTQPRILIEAGASASDFILYRATGSSYGSASWYKTLTIQSNGSFRTHKADSNLRPYPIIGGPDIGSSDAEYGQFNYADVMAPNGDLGSWVYLGTDYHGAHPYPVKCYKIAKHEPGNNGTRVYQIWHDGDSNHHYGALYEVRLNSWGGGDSNNYFTSATISCVNGMRDDISLLCYKSTDGIWVRPSTIWGGIFIRRAGWDGSGRDRGSSYCAVKNGGALAYGDINGLGGTIPGSIDKRLYPYCDTYSPGSFYGGRDIEDGNDFVAG